MPLASYGVLIGSVAGQRAEGGTDSPHYQIHVSGGETDFRVAVNVWEILRAAASIRRLAGPARRGGSS
jgi:hypothetical protein